MAVAAAFLWAAYYGFFIGVRASVSPVGLVAYPFLVGGVAFLLAEARAGRGRLALGLFLSRRLGAGRSLSRGAGDRRARDVLLEPGGFRAPLAGRGRRPHAALRDAPARRGSRAPALARLPRRHPGQLGRSDAHHPGQRQPLAAPGDRHPRRPVPARVHLRVLRRVGPGLARAPHGSVMAQAAVGAGVLILPAALVLGPGRGGSGSTGSRPGRFWSGAA